MNNHTSMIPKKIWFFWFQGLSQAPLVVKVCLETWKANNPDWEIICLDANNLNEYINLSLPVEKFDSLPREKQANLVRLQLLEEYGGVWTDATIVCMRPLDDWLHDYTQSGFFAFYKPSSDRIMDNWFLVAEKNNPIVVKLKSEYTSFFFENTFNNRGRIQRKVYSVLKKLLNKNEKTTKYWFSWIVVKGLKIYPYYIFHYMFQRLITEDEECRLIWDNTKKYSAKTPLSIKHSISSMYSQVDEDTKRKIDQDDSPIYKLCWKTRGDEAELPELSLLSYLFEKSKSRTFIHSSKEDKSQMPL